MDINLHRFLLVQILKEIYSDTILSNLLGFKGGSALMFFYELPRFSVDLDFNLLNQGETDLVYEKVRKILLTFGSITDEAKKFFGPLLVLDYGSGERKLKVEISNRNFNDHYELKNLLGIHMKVMTLPDMFSHKLCALTDRSEMANRDLFDCWFFMNKRTPLNGEIIENRIGITVGDYLQKCITFLENKSDRGLLNGLGELIEPELKNFVRSKLRSEVISLLRFYKTFPIS
jgi:predicted nucleotidyltransferase component of viral defense system